MIGKHLATFNLFREADHSLQITIAEAQGVRSELGDSGAPLALCAMNALYAAVDARRKPPLSPTLHPSDREAIARALYEHWVGEVELQGGEMAPWARLGAKETWLSRADAILALFPTPAKTGERGAVIEECARICDRFEQGCEPFISHASLPLTPANLKANKQAMCRDMARAIRALSQPLPDAPIVGGEG